MPRRTEKLSEVLAREIVRDLRNLEPSTMLPSEAIMLEKYGVGRASLREALRLLEVQGLIVIRPGPGGGPMVAQVDSAHYARISSLYYHMSDATYHDIVTARLVLEPVVARLITERQDPEHIATLRAYVEENPIDAPTDGLEYEQYVEKASGFHRLIMGMVGNPVLALSAQSLQDVLLGRTHAMYPTEEQGKVHKAHIVITKAIIAGQPAKAERLMRDHMQEYVNYSIERFPGLLDETVDWH